MLGIFRPFGTSYTNYTKFSMSQVACLFFLFLLSACATTPLPKTLPLDHPLRLGIIGFKVSAPIHHLSSIAQTPQNLNREEEPILLNEALRHVEDQTTTFLVAALNDEKAVVPLVVPEGLFETHRGERPTPSQIDLLRKELGVDAILYGEIPWYGRTRLIYPILGESLDIVAESVAIGLATGWNPVPIFANVGFELLTSTPLWFGGYYLFGWALRPVTIEAWVLSTADGKQIWHKSVDRMLSRKILKTYPESERSKKEIQLEASLHKAIGALAKSLSK